MQMGRRAGGGGQVGKGASEEVSKWVSGKASECKYD